nr:citrate-binding protein-like [Lolium perenne]
MVSPLSSPLLLLLVAIAVHCAVHASASGANPTAGFVKVDLTDGNFQVLDTDKPFNTATHTNPRTEVRLQGHDYSSGVWQFQGYGGQVVEDNIYDRWFWLNVVHDVDKSTVAVYIDGEKRFATDVTPNRS